MLPIRQVDRRFAASLETLGTKRKFWFRDGGTQFLFKAEERGTGEDWAEVVVCHLCELLSLPHVIYELATELNHGISIGPGSICPNMAPKPASLILGNELLLSADSNYPSTERFKVSQYTVAAVSKVIQQLLNCPEGFVLPQGIVSAIDVFVGYIMLDAWIANQDRHHENWGAILVGNDRSLAPTFDHASSLGRNLTDDERNERLRTRDRNRTVEAFAHRGQSAFHSGNSPQPKISTIDAFRQIATQFPSAANVWLDQLGGIDDNAIRDILVQVPNSRMSRICKDFTLELLKINQKRLLSLRQ